MVAFRSLFRLFFLVSIVWFLIVVLLVAQTLFQTERDSQIDGHGHKLRRQVGYFVGENRLNTWGFLTHLPNYETVGEKYKLDTLGENGVPVVVNITYLGTIERKKRDKGLSQHAYNEYVGNLISVRRKIPDARTSECKNIKYPSDLPATSIIICFFNEAWTSLLRTLHSIIDRTPPRLIHEIILVDDNSTLGYLQEPLEEYISQFPQIKLFRTGKREGLIRARLFGLKKTSPQTSIVTFLDSHIECFEGWLEPLLAPIADDPRAVTTPTINVIDYMTFAVDRAEAHEIGVLLFPRLKFSWMYIPLREMKRRKSPADPIRSPAMAGGLFSITKSFFNYMGTYDEQMDVWGGENIEMSLKSWMCGGSILQAPCSHVGHIFRKRQPYRASFAIMMRNLARVANVWLDDHKIYFQNYNGKVAPYGDITERLKLKERLQCHSFDWYRRNVFPELYFYGSGIHRGQIESVGAPDVCIDAGNGEGDKDIIPYKCGGSGNQGWDYTELLAVRQTVYCMDLGTKLTNKECQPQNSQRWIYKAQLIQNKFSKQCIGLSKDLKFLEMQPCDSRPTQLWKWEKVREPLVKDFYEEMYQ